MVPVKQKTGQSCKRLKTEIDILYAGKLKLNCEFLHWGKEQEVDVTCSEHGDFKAEIGKLRDGSGCPRCKIGRVATKPRAEFIEEMQQANPTYTLAENIQNIYLADKLTFFCTKHSNVFEGIAAKMLMPVRYTGCEYCRAERHELDPANKKRPHKILTDEEIGKRVFKAYGSRYSYIPGTYKYFFTPIQLFCNEHRVYFNANLPDIMGKQPNSCPVCKGKTIRGKKPEQNKET